MMFFCNIPKKGCISGKIIPTLSIRMGAEGESNTAFPDSGRPLVWIGASWWGSGPCSSIAGDWFLADHNAQEVEKLAVSSLDGMRRVREHGRGGSCPNLLLLPGFGPTNVLLDRRLSGSNHLVRLSWPELPVHLYLPHLPHIPDNLHAPILSNCVYPTCSSHLFDGDNHAVDGRTRHSGNGCDLNLRDGPGGRGDGACR